MTNQKSQKTKNDAKVTLTQVAAQLLEALPAKERATLNGLVDECMADVRSYHIYMILSMQSLGERSLKTKEELKLLELSFKGFVVEASGVLALVKARLEKELEEGNEST